MNRLAIQGKYIPTKEAKKILVEAHGTHNIIQHRITVEDIDTPNTVLMSLLKKHKELPGLFDGCHVLIGIVKQEVDIDRGSCDCFPDKVSISYGEPIYFISRTGSKKLL